MDFRSDFHDPDIRGRVPVDKTFLVQLRGKQAKRPLHIEALKKHATDNNWSEPVIIKELSLTVNGYIVRVDDHVDDWKKWLTSRMSANLDILKWECDTIMGTASYRHTQTDYEYLHQLSKGAQDKNNEYVTSSQTRGAGVTIHILDDGYRPIYPKAPATTTAPESYAYSWPPGAEGIVDIDESRFVQNYTSIPLSNRLHGFNVANYAAGKTLGTATDANVCIQKVTSWYTTRNGETESRVCISLVLEAFEEILEHAEQEKKQQKEPKEYKPFKVINCSWGVDPKTKGNQDIVSAALDSILASGCIVVASAGNHGVKLIPGQLFPLNKEGVITVGAVDKEDQIWQKFEATVKTGGSNFGDMVEIYAPGVDLPLYGKVASKTKPGEWVKTVSGTSYATPLVSGIVAGIQSDRLADSRNPLSTKAIRDLLQKSFSKPTKSKSSVEDKNPDLSMKINTEYRVLRSFT